MRTREELERRVKELEAEVALLRGQGIRRPVRYRSEFTFAGLPLLAVATGPDIARREVRGHARGIVAIGDISTGVIALGGFARGIVALGGVCIGVFSVGGLSLGAALAVGGLAIGTFAIGGAAVGGAAIGGGAVGMYACGGGVAGEHTVGPYSRDSEALSFFAQYGLEGLCQGSRLHRPAR
jgi:hypothetical protein